MMMSSGASKSLKRLNLTVKRKLLKRSLSTVRFNLKNFNININTEYFEMKQAFIVLSTFNEFISNVINTVTKS